MKTSSPVNFQEKFAAFDELWAPKVIAEMNDYQFKLVKIKGEFVWHDHKDTDEVFIVLTGGMDIEFRDGVVHLEEGELFVVPRGIEHRPRSSALYRIMVVEPKGVVNTGEAGGALTAPSDMWI